MVMPCAVGVGSVSDVCSEDQPGLILSDAYNTIDAYIKISKFLLFDVLD